MSYPSKNVYDKIRRCEWSMNEGWDGDNQRAGGVGTVFSTMKRSERRKT